MSAVCPVLPMIPSARGRHCAHRKRLFRVLRCRRFVQPCLVCSCMIDTCAQVIVGSQLARKRGCTSYLEPTNRERISDSRSLTHTFRPTARSVPCPRTFVITITDTAHGTTMALVTTQSRHAGFSTASAPRRVWRARTAGCDDCSRLCTPRTPLCRGFRRFAEHP